MARDDGITGLYGQLASRAAEAGLPLDWPSHFFSKSSRTKEEPPAETTEQEPDPAPKPAA